MFQPCQEFVISNQNLRILIRFFHPPGNGLVGNLIKWGFQSVQQLRSERSAFLFGKPRRLFHDFRKFHEGNSSQIVPFRHFIFRESAIQFTQSDWRLIVSGTPGHDPDGI